ncbi:MAG TPA: YfiR family protein [Candidatus Acidoferrum sp.]|nr:YfiR family protein [Candidatus Acidoferrum sp.]
MCGCIWRKLKRDRWVVGGRVLVACVLAGLAGWCPTRGKAGQTEASNEYALKAEFLFHFAQFVEWPASAFEATSSRFVYCTTGTDPFHGALETTLSGKTAEGRGFEVRHLKQAREAQGCHILFIGREQEKQSSQAVWQLQGTPVLIVGESAGFVERGGLIGFSVEESKVRFEINLEAAEKSKLKISAKLLALAKTVIGVPKRG